jgi:hypothetical protein
VDTFAGTARLNTVAAPSWRIETVTVELDRLDNTLASGSLEAFEAFEAFETFASFRTPCATSGARSAQMQPAFAGCATRLTWELRVVRFSPLRLVPFRPAAISTASDAAKTTHATRGMGEGRDSHRSS